MTKHDRIQASILAQELRLLSVKLRSLGYLLEMEKGEDLPQDFAEIRWGVGMLVSDVSYQIRELSRQLEKTGL